MIARKITFEEWDRRYQDLLAGGLQEPDYGGPLRRHLAEEGNLRLAKLQFDNSAAALRLWNFLLSENERLHKVRSQGIKLVGAMKDLGTVPIMAYALPAMRAFYPDGAWWTPCLMECSDKLLQSADTLGIDATFCPVRAMVPAFLNAEHFPAPDLLICSSGAVCDDFSAIAQRLQRLGFPVRWWEIPRRRLPGPEEPACVLPGGLTAPLEQVNFTRQELERVRQWLSELAGQPLPEELLTNGIKRANRVRRTLRTLRGTVYRSAAAPLPGLELLVAEMLALHFCSDFEESLRVLEGLLAEAQRRITAGESVLPANTVRIYWVNPVADVRAINLLEDCGGRIRGSDYMLTHALDLIPEDLAPMDALARIALADPMIGSAADRAHRIVRECSVGGAEALVISRIPGASHCAREGAVIRDQVHEELGIPTLELEVPHLSDAMLPTLRTRLEALIETCRERRRCRSRGAAN